MLGEHCCHCINFSQLQFPITSTLWKIETIHLDFASVPSLFANHNTLPRLSLIPTLTLGFLHWVMSLNAVAMSGLLLFVIVAKGFLSLCALKCDSLLVSMVFRV